MFEELDIGIGLVVGHAAQTIITHQQRKTNSLFKL
jgi:hypothetical protein